MVPQRSGRRALAKVRFLSVRTTARATYPLHFSVPMAAVIVMVIATWKDADPKGNHGK
jgi:hypothetical protein